MSNSKAQDSNGPAVGNCVHNLIHAFSNGCDIFKRLRERRRRRKHSKQVKDQADTASIAEVQLSNSLKRGTADIQSHYQDHYYRAGDRFAKGDCELPHIFRGTSWFSLVDCADHSIPSHRTCFPCRDSYSIEHRTCGNHRNVPQP
jgi:hypothetical protein